MALNTAELLEKTLSAAIKHPVRLTALLYLREAVHYEAYEECSEIINIAKEFEATQDEIASLLEDPRRTPRA